MAAASNNISLTKIGAWAGSLTAIFAFLWLMGEPFLEDYVDSHISTYEERKKEEESHKVSLRHLLGDKMGVSDDEVHIELGRLYKNENRLKHRVDSLVNVCIYLENEIKLNLESLQLNYHDIKKLQDQQQNLRQELSHHGIFR